MEAPLDRTPTPDTGPPTVVRLALPQRMAVRTRQWLATPRAPMWILGLVCAVSFGARIFHLDNPKEVGDQKGFIFDEKYYVNAARVIAGVAFPADDTYNGSSPNGTDPNGEHPQLGKVVIAAGIRLFGDNPVGWRIGAVIFGMLAILAMFWLVRELGGSRWLAVGTASLMAFENLELVHGRIAVLDVYALPLMLAGMALYLRGRPILAGLSIGVATDMKLFGGYALLAVLLLEAFRGLAAVARARERRATGDALGVAPAAAPGDEAALPPRQPSFAAEAGLSPSSPLAEAASEGLPDHPPGAPAIARAPIPAPVPAPVSFPAPRPRPRGWLRTGGVGAALCTVSAVVSALVVLAVLDRLVPAYSGGRLVSASWQPWKHLQFMYTYGRDLRSPDGPKGIAAYPWQFWYDVEAANYYTFNQYILVGIRTTQINTVVAYQGLVNPVLLALWPLALGMSAVLAVRRRDDMSFVAIAWVLGTWLPALAASALDQRTEYLYYMVVILPGVFIATARLLAARFVPRVVLGIWIGLFAAAFCILYPFRDWSSVPDFFHLG